MLIRGIQLKTDLSKGPAEKRLGAQLSPRSWLAQLSLTIITLFTIS